MSEEIQTALRGIDLANDERILITAVDKWPGPDGAGLTVEDVPEWMIPNAKVAYGPDGRVIDIASTTGKDIRWWLVVGFCRAMGKNHVPLYYDGEGASAPASLLEKADYVAIRKASAGPWMLVSTPEIREQRKTNDAVAAVVKDALVRRAAERAEKEKEKE